jgi:pullulanase-type alpha-1,6-glucosidase
MFPTGYSDNTTLVGQSFSVYTQVYKPGATESMGQAPQISCTLHWGKVERFGSPWRFIKDDLMRYNGDIGSSDEYEASLTPKQGMYEFTTVCTDLSTSETVWQSGGNGHLTVNVTLPDRRAFWVDQTTIAWNNFEGKTYELHASPDGNLVIPPQKGSGIRLNPNGVITLESFPKFPNLSGYATWRIPSRKLSFIPSLLKGAVAVAAYDDAGRLIDATGLQIQGVLDDLYRYDGELGPIYEEGVPTLKLWAPTAQSVTLHRFADANPATAAILEPMNLDPQTGVWSITGDPSWDQQYYKYEVEVYTPSTGRVERNLITDPYSVNLSENSQRSQLIDLFNDATLKPPGWDELSKPPFGVPEDMAIYEVHVRDFSRDDQTVAPEFRGTFRAFSYDGRSGRPLSDGMSHLQQLAEAGMSHIHLMPAFDIASINENILLRSNPDYATLADFPPDSDRQQAIIAVTRGTDSFNWGYDPYHYGVPEGSYSTYPNDTSRVLEFREMVKSLAESDLRVVLGVVYNHTYAYNRYPQAVLDLAVPGYYYRYDNNGNQHMSSCCPDTASEFHMMEKLMVDTLVRWAKAYKVDGFRFDLMNFHTVENMQAVREALQSLTLEKDGVDGRTIVIYGEGWDFGSAKDKGLHYANQYNMAGTGIGTFNDKIREATHGGVSTNPTQIRQQGFINGQSYDWNGYFYDNRFKQDLRTTMDRLRIGLAGSLQTYMLQEQFDATVPGLYLGGAGYTSDPQEAVNYISKHDNETLYDLNVFKLPLGETGMAVTSMADRVRVQNLGLSIVGLSQGIPFYQLGTDMLRSKSLDRNSYNSGDWFNRVDFTYQSNFFGIGLPPAWDNRARWSIMAPLLRNSNLRPDQEAILNSVHHLREILRIRKSSKLLRLENASDIHNRLRFHNVGSQQKEGLIVMSITDRMEPDLDPNHEEIVILFNANKIPQSFTLFDMAGRDLTLHPIQQEGHDPVVKEATFNSGNGEFQVPPRTTAVFVSAQTAPEA